MTVVLDKKLFVFCAKIAGELVACVELRPEPEKIKAIPAPKDTPHMLMEDLLIPLKPFAPEPRHAQTSE